MNTKVSINDQNIRKNTFKHKDVLCLKVKSIKVELVKYRLILKSSTGKFRPKFNAPNFHMIKKILKSSNINFKRFQRIPKNIFMFFRNEICQTA